jgi:PDZ domain-containing protein
LLQYKFTFPFNVTISLDKVGGPSAGMMFALGIIDTVTPGDLTGGKHIAGTGTITPDGTVGPIGGIGQKMQGARSGGATLFLAPAANCGEVVGHVPDGLQVVKVENLAEAREAVRVIGSGGDTSGLPGCTSN